MGILDGQVAIMTGGGTGVGRAAALMLAAEGAQVVVAGRRKAPIEAVAGEIAKAGGRAVARACDVAKPAEARALAVNLTGVYALTQAVLPSMIERGGGTIVTISSLAALRPGLIGGAPYGAAKAGVLNLMGHVHNVLREKGIRATTIMPAEVDTPILDNRPLNPDDAARATMLCVTLPPRTVIETMVMSPTILRDQSADLKTARDLGAPPGVK